MGRIFQLSKARKNLGELVNEAYYDGKLFGISKGKKPMGVLVGAKEWKEIIETIEMHDQGLADTLVIKIPTYFNCVNLQVCQQQFAKDIRGAPIANLYTLSYDRQAGLNLIQARR